MSFGKVIQVMAMILCLLLPLGAPVSAQQGCGTVYVVQPGDTLSEIANRCNVSVQDLLANNLFINDSNQIYPGWVLDLTANPQSVLIPETGGPVVSEAFYVVKAGDSLSYIARRLGTSEEELLSANPQLAEEGDLSTGQILLLPGSDNSPAAAVSPRVIEPGQQVTVVAAGFPANTNVQIVGGPLGQRGQILRQVQTNDEGGIRATVEVPPTASPGNRWTLVVRSSQNVNIQALSNLLYVVDTSGPEESILFTVRVNDTLSAIAARFGVSENEILAVNPQIESASLIRTGQDILIPGQMLREQFEPGQAVLILEPNAGPPGTEVEVYARGLPEDTPVDLRIGPDAGQETALVSRQLESSSRGTIYTTMTIPNSVNLDDVLVFIADPENDGDVTPPSQLFYVNLRGVPVTGDDEAGQNPSLQLTPSSGQPGSDVLFSAEGLAPEIPVQLAVGQMPDNPDYVLQLRTNRQGQLRTFLPIPETSNTTTPFTITLTPLQGGGGQQHVTVFLLEQVGIPETGDGQSDVESGLSLQPVAGEPGTIFTVELTGYPANTPFSMGIGRSQQEPEFSYQYRTGSDGNFLARVQVPTTVNASDYFSITITPEAALLPVLRAYFDVTQP